MLLTLNYEGILKISDFKYIYFCSRSPFTPSPHKKEKNKSSETPIYKTDASGGALMMWAQKTQNATGLTSFLWAVHPWASRKTVLKNINFIVLARQSPLHPLVLYSAWSCPQLLKIPSSIVDILLEK